VSAVVTRPDTGTSRWDGPDLRPRLRSVAPGLTGLVALGVALTLGRAAGPLAGAAGAGVVLAAAWVWVACQGRRVLRALRARRLGADEWRRLTNVVHGVAADVGIAPPSLWIFDGGPNALVCRARGRCLAVARTLLETSTRTELEAVAAHCLLRLRRTTLTWESVAVAFGRLGPRGLVTSADDVRTAALTRYPPALHSAIARAEPPRRGAAFWFVAKGPSHEAREARLEVLADL
jgi:hypothetical protein